MNYALILIALVIFLCLILNKISGRLGIPVLLTFIILGMVFGSDGILKIPFDNYNFAETICSFALIFIMFYGGFGTNWKEAKPIAGKAILLSTLGVIITAGLTGLFCYFMFEMDIKESMLIGSLLGSTDAASVFSILRSKKLNLKYNTASMLEIESGSNDPCAYMLTAISIAVIKGGTSTSEIVTMILSQIIYGIAAGILIALVSVFILKRIKFTANGFDTIFVVGVAIISYALPSAINGNGYLSAYLAGIIMGNSDIGNKKTLVPFFDGINGLMQILIFFLLGLLAFPSRLPEVMPTSILIAVFMTFIARPIAVFGILTPFKSKIKQEVLVSWAGLRGAASIVFSIMAVTSVKTHDDIFHIVFCVVLFSILLQGSLLPFVSEKIGMIDKNGNVMKTFTDYSDEVPIQFVSFTVNEGHQWCEKEVKDILLPPDTILALLIRDEKQLVPVGNTKIMADDNLILCAKSPEEIKNVNLTEHIVEQGSSYIGKSLSELNRNDLRIIMIQREEHIVIPDGNTKINENDILVINHIYAEA